MKLLSSSLFTVLIVAGIYEALRLSGLAPKSLLPSVQQISAELIADRNRLCAASLNTMYSVVLSLLLTVPLSLGMAFLMSLSRSVHDMLMPLLITLKSLPAVALLPLMVLLLRRPLPIQVALTISICFLPLTLAGYNGLKSARGGLRNFAIATCPHGARVFWLVTFPGAASELLLGLKLTLPLAFVGTLVAEMSNGTSGGIGNLILTANNYADYGRMFAGIIAVAVISTGSYLLLVFSIQKVFPASREVWL